MFFPFGSESVVLDGFSPEGVKKKAKSILALNSEQEAVYERIKKYFTHDRIFLLHGITGSGKTALYVRLCNDYFEKNKQVIMLVPEITLTPQLILFLTTYYNGKIAVIHSKIPVKEKYYYWNKIISGEITLVIGARSAVFAPVKNLGLIILDEENDSSYKNNSVPRYSVRHIAQQLSKLTHADVLLGSATPSIESYYQAENKKIGFGQLLKRYYETKPPAVEIVRYRRTSEGLLSEKALNVVKECLSNNKQIMIYYNHRGYGRTLQCAHCGVIAFCPNCSVTLYYYKKKQMLLCHYCGFAEPFNNLCISCGAGSMECMFSGIEVLEEEIRAQCIGYKVLRMDSDSAGSGKKIAASLKAFRENEYHILIGTQMIAKGHDFPGVELVVILNPESVLSLPDFRSSERIFSQIVQAAGRAGRRENPGQVMLQSSAETHYAVTAACSNDYKKFYIQEIQKRKIFNYPPFSKLLRIVIRGIDSQRAADFAEYAAKELTALVGKSAVIIGPAPCIISKINGNFRWNLLCKILRYQAFMAAVHAFKKKNRIHGGLYIEYDMDPIDVI